MATETILTDAQIEQGRHDTFSTQNPFCPCESKTMRKAARWAERAVLKSPKVQALLEALEESNSLLVACAHEKRPWREIEDQLRMNRDALIDMERHAE